MPRRSNRVPARLLAVSTLVTLRAAVASAAQHVHVVARVPADTPAADPVYLAGSLPAVGAWRADGLKLARQPDGTYAGDVDLDAGQTLEFKFDRGSWDTVEKAADGGERANRSAAIDASTKRIDATVDRWASNAPAAPRASTVVGTLEVHEIDSAALGARRTIRVWLPPGYDAAADARYPVLYMQDGQNCFDRATSAFGDEWQIDETLTRLIADKTVPPLIVVGVDNGGAARIDEYTYAADPRHGGGRGDAYARFLLDEVKPFVEKTYRADVAPSHTFVGGSSLGGLISLEIARRHPGVFGGAIAMSPSLWWAGESLTNAVAKDAGGLAGTRVWLDMGTRETVSLPAAGAKEGENERSVDQARRLDAALTDRGVEHRLTIDEGASHNEAAWAKRFPQAIAYLLHHD